MNVKEKLVDIVCDPAQINGCIHRCNHKPCAMVSDIVDALIAHGVTVQEWISVNDRLPEAWKQVLIYSRHDFCESAVYIGIPGKWRVTWNHEMLEADSVTHWMPLPEPPKGE